MLSLTLKLTMNECKLKQNTRLNKTYVQDLLDFDAMDRLSFNVLNLFKLLTFMYV